MGNYNTGKIYNQKIIDLGANYNSAPYLVQIQESGSGNDLISLTANINMTESGQGNDSISVADNVYFFVTEDNVLLPLGVYVSGDSREELLPSTRDITEEVPGKHGEYDFGTEYKARMLELVCRTIEGLSAQEKATLKRTLAKHLDPTKGAKILVFATDIERAYQVKFSGKIDPKNFPGWFEFSIPFKMSDPFIKSTFENSLTGSGTITNDGNFDAPVVIEIAGPATNPVFEIDGTPHIFVGTINEGETVIIDTGTYTAKKGNTNVFSGFASAFASGDIVLSPGNTTVSASDNISFKWFNRWI